MPIELASLPNLEILLISECNLPFIPPVIWKCKNLKVLDISRNKINYLPPDIGNLELLQHLNAQQTSITTLPPEVCYCQELEEALLWGNVIESLPETMKELPRLKYLAINYRSFCSIVDSYMEGLLKKGQIQSEHIPPVLFEMPALDLLDLNETKVNWLPDRCVGKFKEFYLSRNFFQKMPSMIAGMDSLEVFDISGNQITVIPEQFGQLTNLKIFKMNDNNVDVIPGCIGNLTNLEELALGGNKLTQLPDEIGNLKNLKTLTLDRNEIRILPETITKLERLETLDLTSNNLNSLPTNFYQMQKLTSAHMYQKFHKYGLWLHKNPLKTPPPEVWRTDNPQIIYTYLKKLQIKKTENLQRLKLVVLGEAQCGKSSLLRALMTGKSNMTHAMEDATPMVDYLPWKTDNDVCFIVYDLGGDEIYKVTHPMFLDPKALYLIVYDHRKYTPQQHYEAIGCWLEMLWTFVPSAVVKVVGTQCDQCYPDFVDKIREQVDEGVAAQVAEYQAKIKSEMENISERLANPSTAPYAMGKLKKQKFQLMLLQNNPLRMHGDICLVSAAEGIAGVNDLINELELMAVNKSLFPHAQRYIPNHWVTLCAELKKRADYCLTLDEVQTIGKRHSVTKDQMDEVLQFFNDCGEVLWMSGHPTLRHSVFQRPRQITETLRGFIRHDMSDFLNYATNRLFASMGQFSEDTFNQACQAFRQSGELSRPFLKCLWFYLKLDYEAFYYLLEELPKMDICYSIPQGDIPPKRTQFTPLVVIPHFNTDSQPEDITELWPALPPSHKELSVSLTFPLLYPVGVFEKLASRIQEVVLSRTDWRDLIHAELECGSMLLTRGLDPKTYDCVIAISIRGELLEDIRRVLSLVVADLQNLIARCRGLIYHTTLSSENISTATAEECFPKEILEG